MTSEIRANTLKNRVGLGTVSFTNTGPIVSGIITANSFSGPYNGTDIVGTGITLTSTDAGSAAGPELKLFRNSASPANSDYLGQIKFAGESSTGVERNYAKITGKILSVTNGAESGILEFAHIKAGTQTITGRWRSDSLQLLNNTNFSVAGTSEFTGSTSFIGAVTANTITIRAHAGINFTSGNWSGNQTKIQNHNNFLYLVAPTNGFQFRIGATDLWLIDTIANNGTFYPNLDNTRDIGKSNRRVRNVYATTLYGDGSNLTGITQTTINNNATTKFITGTNNANELDCEANLSYNNSLVTFSNSSLMVDKSTNATISVKETTGNKEAQFRANTDGGLLRTLGNYPLIFGTNQTEKVRIDSAGRVMIGTTTEGNGNADEFTISYINHAGVSGGDQGRCGMTIRSGDNTSGVTQNGYIYFSDGTSGSNESMGVVAYEHSTDSMYFSTAQVEKLRIKSTGEVPISDRNSSNTGDHFFQAGAFGIRMEDTGGFNRWNIERNYGGYQSTPLIHLSAQGKVGINSATPFQTLDVRGSINGGTVNQPFLRFHDSHGDQRSTKHYFRCTKGGTSIYDILTVDINTNFHQALIILYYGARLQAINDSVTYPVHKIIGVNRFNGGSIQFTKNTIVQDGNVANHGDIDAVAMSSTQYRIRLTFSGSTGGSSFAAGHVEIIGLGPGTDGAFYSLAHAHGLTR